MMLAACGGFGADGDVKVRIEGSHVVIENLSGAAIHVHTALADTRWLAASLPGNEVAHGGARRLRILPSQRGQALELVWWRPGARIGGSDVRGPDQLRRVSLEAPLLREPIADDDALVLACVRVAALAQPGKAADEAKAHERAAERQCAARAERECALGSCALVLDAQRKVLAKVQPEASLPPALGGASAPTPTPAARPTIGTLDFARAALEDLYGGRPAQYAQRLCRGAMSSSSVDAARLLGEALASKGDLPTRMVARGTHEVTFGPAEATARTQGAGLVRVRFGNMAGEALCLVSVDEVASATNAR